MNTEAEQPTADKLDRDYTKQRIQELTEEGDGFWRPCLGCQESSDGCVSIKDYPYSETFRCQPGSGCGECGGIGVIWDDTDYEDYARFALSEQPTAASDVVECAIPPSGWRCTRQPGHEGPCAAIPATDDPLVDLIRDWLMSTDHPVSKWERDFAAAIRNIASLTTEQPTAASDVRELLREARDCLHSLVGETLGGDLSEANSGVKPRGSYNTWVTWSDRWEARNVLARIDATLSTQPSESEGLAAELERIAGWVHRPGYEDECVDALTDLLPRILTALRSADRSAVLSGWQPIETAPKDGTSFVGSDGHYAYRTALGKHYVKWPHEEGGPTFRELWNAEDGSSLWPWKPTNWMPLPEAPEGN